MKADLVIENGIVCTENGLLCGGLAVKDGIIIGCGPDAALPEANSVYDAHGNYIFPGIVEPHSHHGINIQTYEGFGMEMESESRDAAQGGITTINTTTLFGGQPLQELYQNCCDAVRKRQLFVDAKITAVPGSDEQIDEIPDMFHKGVSAFKFMLNFRGEAARMFGMAEQGIDTGRLYRAFSKIAQLGSPAMALVHCEDPSLFEYLMPIIASKETNNYAQAYSDARPNICEPIDLAKAAYVAHEVGCPLYMVHVSTEESCDLLEYFKVKGFNITVETCLHYLIYACDDKIFENNEEMAKFAKVTPAIHDSKSREHLWKALQNGTIQIIGTDHIASSFKRDRDFWSAMCGVGGSYSVLLPIMFSEGVNKGRITIDILRRVLSENPAKAFGLYPRKGTLNLGSDADVVIIDPNREMIIDYREQAGAGEFSIYQGMKVKGLPVATFARGRLVAENYKVVAEKGNGRILTAEDMNRVRVI